MSVEADVATVIETYVKGAATADPDLVKSTCHESASFRGFLGEQFTVTSPDEYATTVVATAPAPGDEYKHQIHSVTVVGNIATAILDEQGYLGFDFRDYFGLARIEGEWKIVSKVFTTI